MPSRPRTSGWLTTTRRSKRPGRNNAGIEYVRTVRGGDQDNAFVRIEAIHLNQQLIQRLFPLVVSASQAGAAVTADSVDLVHENDAGRVLLTLFERSRTRLAPTPTNISTKSDPEIEKNGTLASPAIARASRVFPVPGGPTNSTPFGMRPPSFWNFWGSLRNSMISATHPWLRRPPQRP